MSVKNELVDSMADMIVVMLTEGCGNDFSQTFTMLLQVIPFFNEIFENMTKNIDTSRVEKAAQKFLTHISNNLDVFSQKFTDFQTLIDILPKFIDKSSVLKIEDIFVNIYVTAVQLCQSYDDPLNKLLPTMKEMLNNPVLSNKFVANDGFMFAIFQKTMNKESQLSEYVLKFVFSNLEKINLSIGHDSTLKIIQIICQTFESLSHDESVRYAKLLHSLIQNDVDKLYKDAIDSGMFTAFIEKIIALQDSHETIPSILLQFVPMKASTDLISPGILSVIDALTNDNLVSNLVYNSLLGTLDMYIRETKPSDDVLKSHLLSQVMFSMNLSNFKAISTFIELLSFLRYTVDYNILPIVPGVLRLCNYDVANKIDLTELFHLFLQMDTEFQPFATSFFNPFLTSLNHKQLITIFNKYPQLILFIQRFFEFIPKDEDKSALLQKFISVFSDLEKENEAKFCVAQIIQSKAVLPQITQYLSSYQAEKIDASNFVEALMLCAKSNPQLTEYLRINTTNAVFALYQEKILDKTSFVNYISALAQGKFIPSYCDTIYSMLDDLMHFSLEKDEYLRFAYGRNLNDTFIPTKVCFPFLMQKCDPFNINDYFDLLIIHIYGKYTNPLDNIYLPKLSSSFISPIVAKSVVDHSSIFLEASKYPESKFPLFQFLGEDSKFTVKYDSNYSTLAFWLNIIEARVSEFIVFHGVRLTLSKEGIMLENNLISKIEPKRWNFIYLSLYDVTLSIYVNGKLETSTKVPAPANSTIIGGKNSNFTTTVLRFYENYSGSNMDVIMKANYDSVSSIESTLCVSPNAFINDKYEIEVPKCIVGYPQIIPTFPLAKYIRRELCGFNYVFAKFFEQDLSWKEGEDYIEALINFQRRGETKIGMIEFSSRMGIVASLFDFTEKIIKDLIDLFMNPVADWVAFENFFCDFDRIMIPAYKNAVFDFLTRHISKEGGIPTFMLNFLFWTIIIGSQDSKEIALLISQMTNQNKVVASSMFACLYKLHQFETIDDSLIYQILGNSVSCYYLLYNLPHDAVIKLTMNIQPDELNTQLSKNVINALSFHMMYDDTWPPLLYIVTKGANCDLNNINFSNFDLNVMIPFLNVVGSLTYGATLSSPDSKWAKLASNIMTELSNTVIPKIKKFTPEYNMWVAILMCLGQKLDGPENISPDPARCEVVYGCKPTPKVRSRRVSDTFTIKLYKQRHSIEQALMNVAARPRAGSRRDSTDVPIDLSSIPGLANLANSIPGGLSNIPEMSNQGISNMASTPNLPQMSNIPGLSENSGIHNNASTPNIPQMSNVANTPNNSSVPSLPNMSNVPMSNVAAVPRGRPPRIRAAVPSYSGDASPIGSPPGSNIPGMSLPTSNIPGMSPTGSNVPGMSPTGSPTQSVPGLTPSPRSPNSIFGDEIEIPSELSEFSQDEAIFSIPVTERRSRRLQRASVALSNTDLHLPALFPPGKISSAPKECPIPRIPAPMPQQSLTPNVSASSFNIGGEMKYTPMVGKEIESIVKKTLPHKIEVGPLSSMPPSFTKFDESKGGFDLLWQDIDDYLSYCNELFGTEGCTEINESVMNCIALFIKSIMAHHSAPQVLLVPPSSTAQKSQVATLLSIVVNLILQGNVDRHIFSIVCNLILDGWLGENTEGILMSCVIKCRQDPTLINQNFILCLAFLPRIITSLGSAINASCDWLFGGEPIKDYPLLAASAMSTAIMVGGMDNIIKALNQNNDKWQKYFSDTSENPLTSDRALKSLVEECGQRSDQMHERLTKENEMSMKLIADIRMFGKEFLSNVSMMYSIANHVCDAIATTYLDAMEASFALGLRRNELYSWRMAKFKGKRNDRMCLSFVGDPVLPTSRFDPSPFDYKMPPYPGGSIPQLYETLYDENRFEKMPKYLWEFTINPPVSEVIDEKHKLFCWNFPVKPNNLFYVVERIFGEGNDFKAIVNAKILWGIDPLPGIFIISTYHLFYVEGLSLDENNGIIENKFVETENLALRFYSQVIMNGYFGKSFTFCGHIGFQVSLHELIAINTHNWLQKKISIVMSFIRGQQFCLITDEQTTVRLTNILTQLIDQTMQTLPPYLPNIFTPINNARLLNSSLKDVQNQWINGQIPTFLYISALNVFSGRTSCDNTQYFVYPWVLSDYDCKHIFDCENRDLTVPMGQLPSERRKGYDSTYEDSDHQFFYGSHYMHFGVVLFFNFRVDPFCLLGIHLNRGWDHPNRIFTSISESWRSASNTTPADVKELTPQLYCAPEILISETTKFISSERDASNVVLPTWSSNPFDFTYKMLQSLESFKVGIKLGFWIDLIFGTKSRGEAAVAAKNLFHPLTYPDREKTDDPMEAEANEMCIINFGQCPEQIFNKDHPAQKMSYTWDLMTSRDTFVQQIIPPEHSVSCVVSGTQIYFAPKYSFALPELKNYVTLRSIKIPDPYSTFANSTDGLFVTTGSKTGLVILYKVLYKNKQAVTSETIDRMFIGNPISALAVSSAHFMMCIAYKNCIAIYDIGTQSILKTIEFESEVRNVIIDDNSAVFFVILNSTIIEYSLSCMKLCEYASKRKITAASTSNIPKSFADRFVVVCYDDLIVRFFAIENLKLLKEVPIPDIATSIYIHDKCARCVFFSPDMKCFSIESSGLSPQFPLKKSLACNCCVCFTNTIKSCDVCDICGRFCCSKCKPSCTH